MKVVCIALILKEALGSKNGRNVLLTFRPVYWRTIDGITIEVTSIRHRCVQTPQRTNAPRRRWAGGRRRAPVSAPKRTSDGERVAELDDGLDPQFLAGKGELGEAIKRNDPTIVRWLARKFGDVETARDIAQSAYLRVWRYLQTQKVDNVQALIFKTAANLAANEFRARRRLRSVRVEAGGGSSEIVIEQVASAVPSPEATAVAREEVAASLRAINALPEQTRRAFILSRFEERTYREIAVILGVSESSVEKYIIAALKALREASAEAGPRAVVRLPSRRDRAK